MLQHQHFPKSVEITEEIQHVIKCFEKTYDEIKSPENKLKSDEVLDILRPHLEGIKFKVETGKKKCEKIYVPVLFGLNNKHERSFEVDGISNDRKIILEVEAGRAFANSAFLKDIFKASMMPGVEFLVVAVRNKYITANRISNDFDKIYTFLETLYISNRIILPLKVLLLISKMKVRHSIMQLFLNEIPTSVLRICPRLRLSNPGTPLRS